MWFNKTFVRQALTLFSVYYSTFMFGCASSWFSNAMIFLTNPDHKPFIFIERYGLLAQLFETGRICFAVPGGMMMDKFGRKKIITLTGLLNIVAWTLLSMTYSTSLIYFSRFILGIAAALHYVSSLTTIGEIASPHFRGTLSSINEISNMSGQLFESIVTVVSNSYKILAYSTAIAAFLFLPTLYWLLEPPHFLAKHSNYEKCEKNLAKIRPGVEESQLNIEFKQMTRVIEEEKAKKERISWLNFLRLKSVRKIFKCGLSLNIMAVTCGGPVLTMYITAIVPPNQYLVVSFYPLISFALQFASAFASTLFIDFWPRRTMYMAAASISAVVQAFGALLCYLHSSHPSELSKWALILNCFSYLMVDRGLISPLNAAVRSEIFPQSVKGIGNALSAVCQSTTLVLVYQLYTVVQIHIGLYFNFVIYSINSIILGAVVYFWLPETRGKSLAEVQMAFEGDKKMSSVDPA